MAATVEGAFVLVDRASRVLRQIEKQAIKTDAAIASVGESLDGLGTNEQLRQMDSASQSIRNMGRETETAARAVRRAQRELDTMAGKTRRGFFGMRRDGDKLSTTLKVLAGGFGGVLGGVKGLFTAFPPLITVMAVALPLIIALGGAIGALAVSLGAAVGGAAVIGGGLLGAFAVGIGSIVAVAKPAMRQLDDYRRTVERLNDAMKSGNVDAIRRYQNQLARIDRANPGVRQLHNNLKTLGSRWSNLTRGAQTNFLQLLADGLRTVNGLLPTFAAEAEKNVAAVRRSFRSILGPALGGAGFKATIRELGGIFRAITPGVMRGLVGFGEGFAKIIRLASPTLRGAGDWFSSIGRSFSRYFSSRAGIRTIDAMLRAFGAWGRLLGSIGRLLLSTFQAAGPGTGVVDRWASAINNVADIINRNPRILTDFFSDSIDKAKSFVGLFVTLYEALQGIMPVLSSIADVIGGLADKLGPGGLQALLGAYVGTKVVRGAMRGRTTGVGIVDKLLGGRDGSAPQRALFVQPVGGGLGGGGKNAPKGGAPIGGGGGRGGKFAGLGIAGAAAAGIAGFASAGDASGGPANRLNAFAQGADPTSLPMRLLGLRGGALTFILPGVRRFSDPTMIERFNRGDYETNIRARATAPGVPTTGPMNAMQLGAWSVQHPVAAMRRRRAQDRAAVAPLTPVLPLNFPRRVDDVAKRASAAIIDQTDAARRTGSENFKRLSSSATRSTDNARRAVTRDLRDLRDQFDRQIGAMRRSTSTGFGDIFRQMTSVLSRITGRGPSSASSAAPAVRTKAKGGRIEGVGLRDTVPVSNNTIAAPGELIVNRHTEAKVNSVLAPAVGTTLGGLVDGETRPHFMATGGRIADAGGGAINLMGAHQNLAPYARLGSQYGLSVTSGLRVGSITTSGNISNHSSGNAIDIAGAASNMLAFARTMAARFGAGLDELIHTPLGFGIKHGQRVPPYAAADHYDHVHVADLDPSGLGGIAGLGMLRAPRLRLPRAAGGGMWQRTGQAAIDKVHRRAQSRVNDAYSMAGGGDPDMNIGPMGGGGAMGATTFGGPADPGTGSTGYKGDNLNEKPDSYAELNMGTAMGGLPYMTPAKVSANGRSATLYKRDIGAGGGPIAGLPRKIDLWYQAAEALGLPGAWAGAVNVDLGQRAALGARVPWFGDGTDFIAKRPQVIGVGDGGAERVRVTPVNRGGGGGGRPRVEIGRIVVQNHRQGDIKDQIKSEVAQAFAELTAELDMQPMEDDEEVFT